MASRDKNARNNNKNDNSSTLTHAETLARLFNNYHMNKGGNILGTNTAAAQAAAKSRQSENQAQGFRAMRIFMYHALHLDENKYGAGSTDPATKAEKISLFTGLATAAAQAAFPHFYGTGSTDGPSPEAAPNTPPKPGAF